MILEILSPESLLFNGEVNSVFLPGVDGSFQILNNHAPFVSLLQTGIVKFSGNNINIKEDKANKFTKNQDFFSIEINSGTIEVNENKIIVLVD